MKKLTLILGLALALSWPLPSPAARDALGRVIEFDRPPDRIIPLVPSLTEILYFLGLGDRVVGVTQHSSFPPEAARKPKVGSYIDLNIERILTLAPDLVIGTVDGNERAEVELLEQAGIKAFVVNPRNVRQVLETIETLGSLCGVPERGRSLSARLAGRVERVKEKTRARPEPLVFLQIQIQPIMTVGGDTFHHDLLRLAGGRNMGAHALTPYPRISIEEVIRRKPEVILISSMERGGRFEQARRDWFRWNSIPAVQAGRVHLIDSDLIDRPSPRFIEGLEAMARLIHPEAQWE